MNDALGKKLTALIHYCLDSVAFLNMLEEVTGILEPGHADEAGQDATVTPPAKPCG